MKISIYTIVAFLSCIVLASCTSARWTVKDKSAVDQSDYEILEKDYFLMPGDEISPENPALKLDVYSQTKFEYTERVLMQRTIQEYKLRPGFVALGVGGAAMAFYLANGNVSEQSGTSPKSITLNGIGVLLAASGFFNMKPVDEPRPTGEERYLRSTGNSVKVDTVKAGDDIKGTALIDISYGDKLVMEEERNLSGGSAEISLAGRLSELEITGMDTDPVYVDIAFEDSVYSYEYALEDILLPYARVTSQFASLRNSPEETDGNILADLAQGSQLQIKDSENESWYRVLYGISENFIRKDNAEVVWRSTDFVQEDQVVTIPRVPFGNIDVESNIPILRGSTPNAAALIVTNENYSGDREERTYAHRDGQLMETYLTNALGYSEENIFRLSDVSEANEINRSLSDIRKVANDSTELFVYLSGYGSVDTSGESPLLKFLGTSSGETPGNEISLKQLFDQISGIPSQRTLILIDIDFSSSVESQLSDNESQQILEDNANSLTQNPETSLLVGTDLTYPSSLYYAPGAADKKHHIFPYFFAKALQQRRTTLSDIYQYLERNVSYTARKLFDRPQDPVLIGNTSMDLSSP